MPSPSTVEHDFAQLENIQQARSKLDALKRNRAEFAAEMRRLREEEGNLGKYKQLLEDLNQEKLAHVEELRLINNDINMLESTIKQSTTECDRLRDSGRHSLTNTMRLREESNAICDAVVQDTIPPEAICDDSDLAKLMEHQPPMMPSQYPMMPFLSAGDIQLGQLATQAHMELLLGAQAQMGGMERHDVGEGQGSSYTKQQPPPMKVCNSCQQQIHRNAPICPMCKSKSRSKNPKKPKQRRDDSLL